MTTNLNLGKFRNGDSISEAKTDEEWLKAGANGQPAWCYYDNDTSNGTKYGKLYNWYAVSDPCGLAPKDYHIPSDGEWTILEKHLLRDAGKKMKSTSEWKVNGNGTNKSGFSGLPGGNRYYYGMFSRLGYCGYWWSSLESNTLNAWSRALSYTNGDVYRDYASKKGAFSVRCLRSNLFDSFSAKQSNLFLKMALYSELPV